MAIFNNQFQAFILLKSKRNWNPKKQVNSHLIRHEILYTNIDQTPVNSLHGLLTCEIGGLDYHVTTTYMWYRTRFDCIHIYHLFCNGLVQVIYSGVSGQCSHTIVLLSRPYSRVLLFQMFNYTMTNFDHVA